MHASTQTWCSFFLLCRISLLFLPSDFAKPPIGCLFPFVFSSTVLWFFVFRVCGVVPYGVSSATVSSVGVLWSIITQGLSAHWPGGVRSTPWGQSSRFVWIQRRPIYLSPLVGLLHCLCKAHPSQTPQSLRHISHAYTHQPPSCLRSVHLSAVMILTLTKKQTHKNPPKPPILDPLFSPNCGDSARFWAHFFCQNHPPFSRLSIKPVGASLVPRSTPPRFYRPTQIQQIGTRV